MNDLSVLQYRQYGCADSVHFCLRIPIHGHHVRVARFLYLGNRTQPSIYFQFRQILVCRPEF